MITAASNKKIPHSSLLLLIALIAALTGLFLFVVGSSSGSAVSVNGAVMASFILNGVLALIMLIAEALRRPYSIVLMHWLFYSCFFVITPVSQYLSAFWCWSYPLSDDSLLTANALLFVWGVLFAFFSSSRLSLSRTGNPKENVETKLRMPESSCPPSINTGALLALSSLSLFLLIRLAGFESLFSRSDYSLGLDQTSSLIADKVLRGIPLFAFVLILKASQKKKCTFTVLASFLVLVIAAFPTGLARYNTAAIYGGIMLLLFPAMSKKKGVFAVLFLFAFLIVFPAMNAFRYANFSIETLFQSLIDSFGNIGSGFLTGDYDSYSMFVRAIEYVEAFGSTTGWQLITAILFFIPRSIWPSKGLGSGWTIAAAQGQDFKNVSCPLPGEGMINFGVIGVVAFAIVFGIICRKIDEAYWSKSSPWDWPAWRLFYPFMCFFFFFMLRGDLLSSFAYLIGYGVVYFVLVFVFLRRVKRSPDILASKKQFHKHFDISNQR